MFNCYFIWIETRSRTMEVIDFVKVKGAFIITMAGIKEFD